MALMETVRGFWQRLIHPHSASDGSGLRYFDGILPAELSEISRRREGRKAWDPNGSPGPVQLRIRANRMAAAAPARGGLGVRERFPRPAELAEEIVPGVRASASGKADLKPVDPTRLQLDRMRPQPVPCSARGLALSGGGVRSAAVGLGALQAMNKHERFGAIDYLSTVSGGGYIGTCLSAAVVMDGFFPFGSDVSDDHAVSHLRNYSNYLMPRERSSLSNIGDVAAMLLRGWIANAIVVWAVFAFAVLLTVTSLHGEMLRTDWIGTAAHLIDRHLPRNFINLLHKYIGTGIPSACLGIVLAGLLTVWAIARSILPGWRGADDTRGSFLRAARVLLIATIAMAFIEVQPPLIRWMRLLLMNESHLFSWKQIVAGAAALTSIMGAVSTFATTLGHFLGTTQRSTGWTVALKRVLAKAVILVASAVLPLLVWGSYLALCAWLAPCGRIEAPLWLIWSWLGTVATGLVFAPNAYSLHRFYRDRLAKAFLFSPLQENRGTLTRQAENRRVQDLRLSDLMKSIGPYPILNAAMNIQGSREANRRGRDADFFIFTPAFVGSDLTLFAPTLGRRSSFGLVTSIGIEAIDRRLDLGAAMAISGAAVSSNMGGSTVRTLSPTLALLNLRLGYWLRNPRFIASHGALARGLRRFLQPLTGKFYLFTEMLNLLTEKNPSIYLTDGGHMENLGLYELLKRGCETIVVIDAEADPELAFPSLLRLERFARIDLGVRIDLPWEGIGRPEAKFYQAGNGRNVDPQPTHCAVGKIRYADGVDGTLVYFKSSMTGDEKDYMQDYHRRNPSFPHETTGDQFFSEEQFEMYRALGFHMVDGFFSGAMPFAWHGDFGSAKEAYEVVCGTLQRCRVPA